MSELCRENFLTTVNGATETGVCQLQKNHKGPHDCTVVALQPSISFLFKRTELMPNGSIGAIFIGEFGGDRDKDLRLTIAQAVTLRDQITRALG